MESFRQVVSQNVLGPEDDLQAPNEKANTIITAGTINIFMTIGLL
jgi:hypothetical protein